MYVLYRAHRHRVPDIIPNVGTAVSPKAHLPAGWDPPAVGHRGGDVFPVDYGADPTASTDSTAAFKLAMAELLTRNISAHGGWN